MIILSRSVLNTNVRELLRGMENAELLDSLHTTFAVAKGTNIDRLPNKLQRLLNRRSVDLDRQYVHLYPELEFARQVALGLNGRYLTRESRGLLSSYRVGLAFDSAVARWLEKTGVNVSRRAVYCYEDAAVQTFETAKELGLSRFYELPILYWHESRRLLSEESARYPEWHSTVSEIADDEEKLENKTREAASADVIICPSTEVQASLPEPVRTKAKTLVARFGSDLSIPRRTQRPTTGKLRVLFAGSLTQRKGLADVFAAMKTLNTGTVELVVMGSCVLPLDFYRKCYSNFIYEPVRPRSDVLQLMQTCDVLLLPSIVEGRALVVQEAMMSGLPILVTPNTGCEDLVDEGQTGFLLPMRNPEAIADRLNWFLENRSRLPEMALASRSKASLVTWDAYRETIIQALRESMGYL